jgi:hypothetical protein
MSVEERRPFRAVEVLSGNIDRKPAPKERTRKQISAQLEPAQLRMLGELHARLNATAESRIEKSDLVGLGIELLAAAIGDAGQKLAPAPGNGAREATTESGEGAEFRDLAELRTYLRTYARTRVP